MGDQLLKILTLEGIQDVEEVFSVRHTALRQLAREELHEVLILPHHRPQLDYRQLVIKRDTYPLDFIELHEPLSFDEYLLQKVLVHHVLWRKI